MPSRRPSSAPVAVSRTSNRSAVSKGFFALSTATRAPSRDQAILGGSPASSGETS